MSDMSVYLFDDGEQHWIVAASKDAAWTHYRENLEPSIPEPKTTCRKLPSKQRLTVTFDDAPEDAEKQQTQTVSEWAREFDCPGILGSTVW